MKLDELKNKLNTIYIISKGRPQCKTANILKKINYPGQWFIVCGNNDKTIFKYQKKWGKNKVLIFDWYKEVKECDLLDNFGVKKMPSGAVPARNATKKISQKRGELRHWQFDDDYFGFYRFNYKFKKNFLITDGKELEKNLFQIALFGYKCNLNNVGFSIAHETLPQVIFDISKRVFNAHNLPSDDKLFIKWRGRMNDDLINALDVWQKGGIEFSFKFLSLNLMPTQKEKGGLTDLYQSEGTVRKTAYAILINPNAVKLTIRFGRYHHLVNWQKVVPKIISEKYAKI